MPGGRSCDCTACTEPVVTLGRSAVGEHEELANQREAADACPSGEAQPNPFGRNDEITGVQEV